MSDSSISADLASPGGQYFQYFDGGDGSPDNAPWTITTADAVPGCSVDATKCTQVAYSDGAGYWGGFFLQFSAAKDLTAYTKLTLYIKGAIGGEKLKIGMKSGVTEVKVNVPTYVTLTTSWQKLEIPFADFAPVSMSAVSLPFIIAFENAYTAGNATVYIDYIGFE